MECPCCGLPGHLEIDLHADGFSADLLECTACGALLTIKGRHLATVRRPAETFRTVSA